MYRLQSLGKEGREEKTKTMLDAEARYSCIQTAVAEEGRNKKRKEDTPTTDDNARRGSQINLRTDSSC